MQIDRILGFHHLSEKDLWVPATKQIFFDPADTEVGAWVGCDLLEEGSTVVDLGSGSGAAAAAFSRCGAASVLGVDISTESIDWARSQYSPAENKFLSFVEADFTTISAEDLISAIPGKSVPDVVTTNPAYVPLESDQGSLFTSIYGGPDGLRFVPSALRLATAFGSKLGLTIGSYSSPRKAVGLLASHGFYVQGVTLAALELGNLTKQNPGRILALESTGQAVLWRHERVGYLIVGLSCVRTGRVSSPTPDQLMQILSCASLSLTNELELLLDDSVPGLADFSVRVLVLPTPSARQHW